MDRFLRVVLATIVGNIIGLLVFIVAALFILPPVPEVIIYVPSMDIPSAIEIQQRLTDLGKDRYDPNGVDGKIGVESQKAWDNYSCDQHAKVYF